MPYVENEHVDQINFLASAKFQSFTEYVDNTNAAVITNDRGRKVIPAGTIYPANDATAKGVTIDEVDVTNNAAPVGVIVEGYLLQQRLPVAPADAAKTAMTGIKWRDEAGASGAPKA
ncbi:hypothetical protein [Lacticaseibacillus yichunensis]|uniref:Prophage protein n=1 Tax=Lacticaseibacillus yichunensis TaxID=2486015 RepID=A0ABW4CNQ6_9LACO|nr:hypothetical protein [Lacticaseibacillus yichunensis]